MVCYANKKKPLGSAVIGSRAPTVRSLRTLLVLFYSALYHQSSVVHICTRSCRSVAHLRNYLPSTANVTDPCPRIFSRLKFGHYQLRRRRREPGTSQAVIKEQQQLSICDSYSLPTFYFVNKFLYYLRSVICFWQLLLLSM